MTATRVGVPVPVVYGGIAAIVSLLVAVGYFAGRASNEGAAAAPAAAASAGTPVTEPAMAFAPAAPPPAAAEPATSVATMAGAPQAPAPAALQPGTAAASPAAPATIALRQEVARYFRQMDATESAAKTWSDPNALAQQILGEAMKGDSSGFDKLVAASAAARDGVRGIDAPPPCAEHHRLTLALLDEAVTILSKLRDGIAAGDPSAVASIATSGSALESRAKAVDTMAALLRAQYGVEAAR